MDLDKMTLGELKELQSALGARISKGRSHSMKVGTSVFIRTVTMFYTGRIKAITASDVELTDAAWIADTGRFNEFLKNGTFNECEPFPSGVIVPRGCIVDISPWNHTLPNSVK